MKHLVFSLILLLFFNSLFGQTIKGNRSEFEFKGRIIGQENGTVHLSYTNDSSKYVNDSCILKNGEFKFKGYIKEPSPAFFYGNRKSRSVDDPNCTDIYIEPNKIYATFKLDSLKYGQIVGSQSQQEFIFYTQQVRILENKWSLMFDAIKEAKLKNDTDRIDQIYANDLPIYRNQSDSLILNFIKQFPKSYVSAQFLVYQSQKISTDSLKMFYALMSKNVQQSYNGNRVKVFITKAEATKIGMHAPEFTLTDINGRIVNLKDFKGKYILLDFWASYCAPCRAEHPLFKKIYSKYQNKGFIIISVSMDTQDKKQDWIAAIKNDSLKWVQICDFKGWSGEVVNMYNLYGKGIPSNFLINPNGLILAKDLHGEDLAKKLKELFN